MPDRNGYNTKVVTVAVFTAIFAYSLVMSLTNTIANEIVAAFSLAGTNEGLMSSMISCGIMLSLVAIPLIQSRMQKIHILITVAAATALQGAALLICGASPVFTLFCSMCVILGICGGFLDTYCNSAIVDVRKADRQNYLGYLNGFFAAGCLVAPPLIRQMLKHVEWRSVFFLFAAISLLTAIVVFLLSRGQIRRSDTESPSRKETPFTCPHNMRQFAQEAADEQKPEQSYKISQYTSCTDHSRGDRPRSSVIGLGVHILYEYFHDKRKVMLALTAFFSTVVHAGILSWIMRYMTLRFDAAEMGALSLTVFWAGASANRFCFAKIINKAPIKFFFFGACLSGVFIFVGVLSASPVVMCIMTGAIGFSSGHFIPMLIGENASGHDGKTTPATSLLLLVMSVSRIITPLTLAYVSTRISPAIGMMIPATAAFVSGGLAWIGGRK
jgi:predicted MFS family arabinose efflux permease